MQPLHLKRFFCEAGNEDHIIRDDVFIVAGEHLGVTNGTGKYAGVSQPWEQYASARSIVLLGPPRQGKTTEFRYQCEQVQNGFFLPLGSVPARGGLEVFQSTIEDDQSWLAWRSGSEAGELFIDALDEGKLATRVMMRDIVAWLRALGEPILRRLRVHLSCRGADWDRADQDDWLKLFAFSGDSQHSEDTKTVVVLVLLDLARPQFEEYCRSQGVDPKQLLVDLPIRSQRFVARPQTLSMIVEDYRQSGRPPEVLPDLYQRVIARRLGEENREHQRAEKILPVAAKRNTAELYAAVTILSDHLLITDQGVGSENAAPMGLSEQVDEEATFLSGLFRSSLRGQYRFDDPELTNYLGACYLNGLIDQNAITATRVVRLFFANPEDTEPVPKLRGLLVWLCALNQAVRQLTLKANPGVLLDDYPLELNLDDKKLVWSWLVSNYDDRSFFDYRPWWEGVKVLACPEIVPQLWEVLKMSNKYGGDIRKLALQIAVGGNLTQLGPVIEDCINTEDDISFLTFAAP
jgi:hypothetical protein